MRRTEASPGSSPALTKEQKQGRGGGPPDSVGRVRGGTDRDGAPARARGGPWRKAARPVPIRPAADRTHRLVLSGRLAHDNAPALEAALDELCDAGVGELVLDMGALRGIDTTGVRVVAMRCELCRRRGIAVRVERLGGAVEEAFENAGLMSRLPLAEPPRGLPYGAAETLDENPQRKRRNIV